MYGKSGVKNRIHSSRLTQRNPGWRDDVSGEAPAKDGSLSRFCIPAKAAKVIPFTTAYSQDFAFCSREIASARSK
jgi:hypothetical protein